MKRKSLLRDCKKRNTNRKNCQEIEMEGFVNVRWGIFYGDSFSSLIFVLYMAVMTLILRKAKGCHGVNQLQFMRDLKLFAENEVQIDSLVKTMHFLSKRIDMEFGLKKCCILILKEGRFIILWG